jgi:Integrase zinc binding domain
MAYPKKNKTYKIISNRYYWPRIVIDINRYVRNCNNYYRSIILQDKTLELLKPLLIPNRP